MALSLAVGKPKPLWKRALPWIGLASLPAGAFLLFVLFLGINQIGNDIPEEPLAPLAEPEEAFLDRPLLYFVSRRYDTRENKERLAGAWRERLSALEKSPLPPGAPAEEESQRSEQITAYQESLARIEAEITVLKTPSR